VSRQVAVRSDTTSSSTTFRPKRLIGLFPELLGVGGIQEAGRQTIAALDEIARRRGWKTLFLSLNDARGEHVVSSGTLDSQFRAFGRAKLRFFLAATRATLDNAAIVLAAHPNLALPAAFMKGLSPQLKSVVICHGVEVWQLLPRVRRAALLRADLLIAPSRYTVQKIHQIQGIPIDKIRRLPWPLSPAFLSLAAHSTKLEPPAEFPNGKVILTVGRWAASERYKGVDDLIRAFAQLRPAIPDLHLVVVGEGDDLTRLQKLAEDMNTADAVHFLQGLSREKLAACYGRADVFALPSTGEGFGMVFLEAMAFGKPIVAAAAGGATDLVENESNGILVPAHNPEQLADALGRLIGDAAFRSTLGRRGFETVHAQYSFGRFESELDEMLGKLA
jgi:phosphatidylinositol alpha-1,6-mannosyltransferase